MNLQITAEYTVSNHYFSALFNDDWSGLDDEDTALLKDWMRRIPAYSTLEIEEDTEAFQRDSVTGLMAECEVVQIWEYWKGIVSE